MTPKIVFLGTPALAAYTLDRLIASDYNITLVITEPDKPAGRGLKVAHSPVKVAAFAANLPVVQPLTKDELLSTVNKSDADLAIVVAYGRIIPASLLEKYTYGWLNLHASLLPRYRGAAPIQYALLNGDNQTGVTIMKLDKGMDTGPILTQSKVIIDPDDTTATLGQKLIKTGTALLLDTIPNYISGQIKPVPQSQESSYSPKITKDQGEIDWNESPEIIERQIRAFNPWPHTFTTWNGKRLIIHMAHLENGKLIPDIVQVEGKRRQSWDEFLRGQHLKKEDVLSKFS